MLKKQTCKNCLKEIRFEFSIQNKIWDKLPKDLQNKELCIECFLEELEKQDPNQKLKLKNFHYLGIEGKLENPQFGGIFLNSNNKERILFI